MLAPQVSVFSWLNFVPVLLVQYSFSLPVAIVFGPGRLTKFGSFTQFAPFLHRARYHAAVVFEEFCASARLFGNDQYIRARYPL